MPCLEISTPRLAIGAKEKLARELTAAFTDASGFPADIFGILFKEYEYGDAASGGGLCTPGDERPYIHLLLYSPRLTKTVKRELGRRFTETLITCTGKPGWDPVIHFCEHPYDNVVIEGELLSEKFAELAERGFYYNLPDD